MSPHNGPVSRRRERLSGGRRGGRRAGAAARSLGREAAGSRSGRRVGARGAAPSPPALSSGARAGKPPAGEGPGGAGPALTDGRAGLWRGARGAGPGGGGAGAAQGSAKVTAASGNDRPTKSLPGRRGARGPEPAGPAAPAPAAAASRSSPRLSAQEMRRGAWEGLRPAPGSRVQPGARGGTGPARAPRSRPPGGRARLRGPSAASQPPSSVGELWALPRAESRGDGAGGDALPAADGLRGYFFHALEKGLFGTLLG